MQVVMLKCLSALGNLVIHELFIYLLSLKSYVLEGGEALTLIVIAEGTGVEAEWREMLERVETVEAVVEPIPFLFVEIVLLTDDEWVSEVVEEGVP